MARKADTLCNGGCGVLLFRGSTSHEIPTCRECRKTGRHRGFVHLCQVCKTPFRTANRTPRKFCSRPCYRAARKVWASAAERYRAKVRSRRARLAAVASEPYSLADIVARDGILCSLCPAEVDMSLPYPDPYSSSVDHVIPVSKGGPDTLGNVRLAHLRCNLLKSDKILE